MHTFQQKLKTILTTGFAVLVLIATQSAFAQGNGKGHGKGSNVGVGNASDGIMARILTHKHIYYTGDPLEIGLRFARGADLVASGDVDAFVVIFSPVVSEEDESDTDSDSDSDTDTDPVTDPLTDAIVLPVTDVANEEEQKLFELEAVDLSTLAPGTYQLGLILTAPGGDPLNINDWHNGLLGLINIVGLTITDEAVEFDADGDGQVDDDSDGDGFSDDDDEEEEEEEEEEEKEESEDPPTDIKS